METSESEVRSLKVNNYTIEKVETLKYLGENLTQKGDQNLEINTRLQKSERHIMPC